MFFCLRLICTRNKITFFFIFQVRNYLPYPSFIHWSPFSWISYHSGTHAASCSLPNPKRKQFVSIDSTIIHVSTLNQTPMPLALKETSAKQNSMKYQLLPMHPFSTPEKWGRERVYWKQDGLNTYQYPT